MTLSQRLLFASLLACAPYGAGCTHTTVRAVLPNPHEPAHGINVSGQGEAKAAHDLARASLGVEVRAETAEQATEVVMGEYARLVAEGLPADELAGGKQQLKGQIMLSLESPMSRMHRLAGVELTRDRYRRLDEILAEIDAVSAEDVRAVAAEFFDPARQTIVRLGE